MVRRKNARIRGLIGKNFQMLLAFSLSTALLTGALLFFSVRTRQKEILAQGDAQAVNSVLEMDSQLLGVANVASNMAIDERVLLLLRTDRSTLSRQLIANLKDVQKFVQTICYLYPLASDVVLYFEADHFFVSHDSGWQEAQPDGIYNNVPMIAAMRLIYPAESGWYRQGNALYYFHNIEDSLGRRGALLILARESELTRAMRSALPMQQARMLLFAGDGTTLASSDGRVESANLLPAQNGLYTENDATYSISWVDSSIAGWRYALILEQKDFWLTWNALFAVVAVLFLAVLGLGVLVAYGMAVRLCRPFDKILELLETPEVISNETYQKDYQKYDALGMIYTLIHQSKYRYLAVQNALNQRERLLHEAQNIALQAQMDPHFLFNTLESVNWMAIARLSEDNEISGMVTRLAKLLRVSLEGGSPLIAVAEEVEHAKIYIEIQQMRFQGRISIDWDIDKSVRDFAMIRLSLQPLIENAIRHGMKNMAGGQIRISCEDEGDTLAFAVSDNGVGIDKEELEKLAGRLADAAQSGAGKIGLANLNARMGLVFGEQYHLEISSEPNVATCVRMRIPKIPWNRAEEYLRQHLKEKR